MVEIEKVNFHSEHPCWKADLPAAIWEGWLREQVDTEYCFSLVKSIHASEKSGRYESHRRCNKLLILVFL